MQDIFEKLRVHQGLRLPFVLYKKPGDTILHGLFQENDHLYFIKDFTEKGFVFAPFDDIESTVLIPKEESTYVEGDWSKPKVYLQKESKSEDLLSAKVDFELLVSKSIKAITNGRLKKVVVSRKEELELDSYDVKDMFEKLISIYPTAFTYCWFHPKVGLWMGATPEKLIATTGKRFYSMSLAGTRKMGGLENDDWAAKEIEEQKIVTDYILENLKKVTSEVSVSSPYTIKAGKLLHIKTDIKGDLREHSNLKEVISILHPTPAVCGLPKHVAQDFIRDNEVYDRGYYTGFMGELNKYEESELCSDLYVNLRCMELKNGKAILYMGCGITASSDPEREWVETKTKSQTMKTILNAR